MDTIKFNQHFGNLSEYLKTFALKLTKDTTLAEDLFQETALLAYKNRAKFQTGTNIKAWMGTIMRNTFINQYRRKKRRNEIFDATPNNYFINSGQSVTSNGGEENIRLEEITKLVDELDEKFRKPFLMAYQGYGYDEISITTNAALGTVKSRIFLARKALKMKIIDLYDGQPLKTTA